VKNKTEKIIKETQRESIINRPHNLAGSVKHMVKERFTIGTDDISFAESNTVPALLKLFMESLDNPIDIAIKGGCTSIQVFVDSESIRVKDNGFGVSSGKTKEGQYIVKEAFCDYNTSSNYAKDIKGKGQKGTNGIGIKLCSTLSTYFKVISDDGIKQITLEATENNLNHKIKEKESSGTTGVDIMFKPDFEIFDATEIDQEHIDRMYEYTLMQALTYPDVTFKFNKRVIRYNANKFMSLFNKEFVVSKHEDFFVAILPNEFDDFKQISYINGLETYRGGTHIDFIINKVVSGIRSKLIKKFKSIKPGDIKNKLHLVLIGKNMHNVDWEGQTKSEMSTSNNILKDYFSDLDIDSFVKKILKTPEIIDPITEVYRIKEELKRREALKNADKKPKEKPKSEKFMPPIGKWTDCFLCEGDSASNSIRKIIGRENKGFFAMFGVPPNAYDTDLIKIIKSKKMIELKNIIGLEFSKSEQTNINFENIIITTDFDLPGHFICGQLLGLFYRYGKNLFEEKRVKRFITPLLVATDKKEEIVAWFYSFEDYQEFESKNKSKGYHYDYKKGLGSWDQDELQTVIEKDGFENMLQVFELDENGFDSIDTWLSGSRADDRKAALEGFEFNIMAQ